MLRRTAVKAIAAAALAPCKAIADVFRKNGCYGVPILGTYSHRPKSFTGTPEDSLTMADLESITASFGDPVAFRHYSPDDVPESIGKCVAVRIEGRLLLADIEMPPDVVRLYDNGALYFSACTLAEPMRLHSVDILHTTTRALWKL